MKKPIVLIGGGGHCMSCIDVIESVGHYAILGILDDKESVVKEVCGYPVIGSTQEIDHFLQKRIAFCITVGQVESPEIRKHFFSMLERCGADLPTIVSSKAKVSRYARIGKGTIVMHSAIINPEAHIGRNCIINSGALIEHGVTVADHVHVSTQAVINGGCVIGEGAFIGSGSILIHEVAITENVVVGAGSVVIRSLLSPGTYAGSPVRKIN